MFFVLSLCVDSVQKGHFSTIILLDVFNPWVYHWVFLLFGRISRGWRPYFHGLNIFKNIFKALISGIFRSRMSIALFCCVFYGVSIIIKI